MNIGDKIPSFSLPDQDWNELSDKEVLGQPFIIYFYPKDDTPGCTKEACSFRDSYQDFEEAGARVIGVSSDSPEEHNRFKSKHDLPFTLLSDRKKELQKAFNVPTNFFGMIPGRVTYIFDKEGTLIHKFNSQMKAEKHAAESLKAINDLS
ncbi:MAG: peroxiredoxin [Salibacteraceae bacterium]